VSAWYASRISDVPSCQSTGRRAAVVPTFQSAGWRSAARVSTSDDTSWKSSRLAAEPAANLQPSASYPAFDVPSAAGRRWLASRK
jgi:hypothetical protein